MWRMILGLFIGWSMPVLFLISLITIFVSFFRKKGKGPAATAMIFLFSLCLYMVLGMIMIWVEYSAWINILIYIFIMLFGVAMIGALSISQIVLLEMKKEYEKIGRTWRMLKCGALIYYCLNTIFWRCTFQAYHDMFRAEIGDIIGFFAYAVLLMVSPYVWIPWAVSVVTGYSGYVYIKYLREQTEGDVRDLIIARERQFVPIFDYISMRKIWKEYK